MEKRTLLIPALLDRHWPLLRWAFESERYHAAVLEEGALCVIGNEEKLKEEQALFKELKGLC